ncbi:hypothetical protein [Streptomyces sp. NPDC004296]|uniref:hypothetical protein n=1 Tax=Streptomyces sp. NPDC004296 TaxID=3364697 RepID=UPI003698AACE
MDQWDEDRQDWTKSNVPEGPQPGTRTARAAVVAASAVVLCVAVGAGIWAWAPDREPDASGSRPPVQTGPSASESARTGPGETAGSGDTAGSGGVPSDPCAAVDDELTQEWGLNRVDADNKTNCRWSSTKHRMFFRLSYLSEPPAKWSGVSSIKVEGVPSATSFSTGMTCMIMWPTSYGSVNLSASRVSSGDEDLCGVGAEFAAAVAPHVPH